MKMTEAEFRAAVNRLERHDRKASDLGKPLDPKWVEEFLRSTGLWPMHETASGYEYNPEGGVVFNGRGVDIACGNVSKGSSGLWPKVFTVAWYPHDNSVCGIAIEEKT